MQPSTLTQLPWLASPPAIACMEPPRLESGVLAYHGPIEERADYDLAQIRKLAQTGDKPLPHAPLGFYIGGLSQDVAIKTERQASPDGSKCDYLTTVTVRLSLVDRVIEVAADFDSNDCERTAVLKHYRRHAAADDRVLSVYVQTVNKVLRKAWPRMAAKLNPLGQPDDDGIRRVVQGILGQGLKFYKSIRAEADAAVDSPTEVESLACGSKS